MVHHISKTDEVGRDFNIDQFTEGRKRFATRRNLATYWGQRNDHKHVILCLEEHLLGRFEKGPMKKSFIICFDNFRAVQYRQTGRYYSNWNLVRSTLRWFNVEINAALFLPLAQPFTLNGAFWKRSAANRRNSNTLALRLSVDGKHFENGAVKNDGMIILWFACPNFPLTQMQNDRWF